MKKLSVLLLTVCLLGAFSLTCSAADWPAKDIEIDVCYTAGGTADTANRTLAAIMSKTLGVNINIVNVTGGSGSIAGQKVLSAEHDGYTWLGNVAHTVSGWRVLDYADTGWEDFYGFYAATAPYVLFVSASSPYNTYAELFEAMKAQPGMKWGTAGLGSINHLTGQVMLDTVGVGGSAIPYGGGREAGVKVIAGEVVFSWAGAADIMDLALNGDIKIIGVCDSNPLKIKSSKGEYDAPSMLKDHPKLSTLEGLLFWGFQIPRDVPAEAVAKIRDAFEKATKTEEWAAYCAANSLSPAVSVGQASDEMCARLESIYAWGLFDNGLAAEGISPEKFEIPRLENFKFPANDRAASAKPWPAK